MKTPKTKLVRVNSFHVDAEKLHDFNFLCDKTGMKRSVVYRKGFELAIAWLEEYVEIFESGMKLALEKDKAKEKT